MNVKETHALHEALTLLLQEHPHSLQASSVVMDMDDKTFCSRV